jgi:hypothetical protein
MFPSSTDVGAYNINAKSWIPITGFRNRLAAMTASKTPAEGGALNPDMQRRGGYEDDSC